MCEPVGWTEIQGQLQYGTFPIVSLEEIRFSAVGKRQIKAGIQQSRSRGSIGRPTKMASGTTRQVLLRFTAQFSSGVGNGRFLLSAVSSEYFLPNQVGFAVPRTNKSVYSSLKSQPNWV